MVIALAEDGGVTILAGAVENVVDLVTFVYAVVGSIYDPETAREMRHIVTALGQFFSHPMVTAQAGIALLRDSFVNALWELDFFEAGRIAGNVVVFLLTLPSFIKSLPRAARALVRTAVVLARLTLNEVLKLGVAMKELADMTTFSRPAMLTSAGILLMDAGEDVAVLGGGGQPIGNISKAEVLAAGAQTNVLSQAAVTAGETSAEPSTPAASEPPTEKPAPGPATIPKSEPVLVEMGGEKADLIKFWKEQIQKEPAHAERYREYIRRIEKGERPTWRQSEREIGEYYRQIGGREEVSFKGAEEVQEVPRGTTGSTRPDVVQSILIEVKNYQIENKQNLITALEKQVAARNLQAPSGMALPGAARVIPQTIVLDFRGQQATVALMKSLAEEVSQATGVPLDHIQILKW